MKRTPNINLPQFEETDRYRLEDYNEAYSIIDKEISDIGTQLDSVNASLEHILQKNTQLNVFDYKTESNTAEVRMRAINFFSFNLSAPRV